ncbi:hypothetical protein CS022_10850 [Veronia nyctiphanis]|uniref:Chloride channel protein n=1 Tax=Veronia nyctiphanis TaxID=1278244 RepID=A0A4Q0YRJ7_9GAMM|nr:hypothetical protein CS022_10850 [Veronia nyctiphanis]
MSAATGYIFSDQIFEIEPLFLIEFSGVENSGEFILFILVGLLSACLALFFISSLLSSQRHAKELPLPAFVKPAIAGFVLGLFALILPEILGIGTEAMRFATIEGAYDIKELAVLIIAKIAVTILCISFGFVGGVFSPLLLIGILFGAFNWLLIDEIFNIPNSGVTAYSIAGMMAVTSPVIGAPLTCILIVFELTRNYELTIAAMVAVVFSNLVVAKTLGRSLFDCQLLSKGINLAEGRDKAILQATSVGTLVRTDFPIACIEESATSLNVKLEKSAWSEAYIISQGVNFSVHTALFSHKISQLKERFIYQT